MDRVVAFISHLSKGGAQRVFVNVINYLHRNGIDVKVVTQTLDDAVYQDEIDKGIEIVDLKAPSAKASLPQLLKYLKNNDIDCAIAFSPELAVNLWLVRKFLRKRFAIVGRCINTLSYELKYADSFFRKHITHNLIKWFYHRVDHVIAQSSGMAEDLVENFGFRSEQVTVINNPVAPIFEAEMENESDDIIRENAILYVGRLEQQKGLQMLLNAFANMSNKSAMLYIVGSGSQKEELEQLALELKINDRVNFIDHTKQIIEYYKKVKVTALSSYFEGFPNVLIESIACGTPVVAYDLPSGPKEIIQENDNGFLVKYLDVQELSEKLDLALDKSWNSYLVKKTAERYSAKYIMEKYKKLVEEALNK